MMLSAALRQELPSRLKAKWKLHSQMQESSKMICNLPAFKRRFAPGIAFAACGKVEITYANAGK